tara:strand:+ start:19834 stop:20217 length:384 start_codon:yes stop_codon:yes gene_type:complete
MTEAKTIIEYVENLTATEAELIAENALEMARIEGLGFHEVIAEYKRSIERSGDMGLWLAEAFFSWYRPDPTMTVDMQRYSNLDQSNKSVFRKMLQLRDYPNWNDEDLYGLLCWITHNGYYTPPAPAE